MNGKSKKFRQAAAKGRLVVTREYIHSFCGIFKLKPGDKSVVQELIEERRAEKEKEDL